MLVNSETILQAVALMGAVGTVAAMIYKGVRWLERQKAQDKEIENIKKEQCVIYYGVMACLEGLEKLGAGESVASARCEMEKHINQTAHE